MFVFDKVKNNITAIEFNLTKRCNYACTYCFVEQSTKNDMSCDMVRELMDNYTVEGKADYDVIFFGGEPLLKAEVILDCLDRYDSIIKSASVLTNGALLTPSLIEQFKKYENKLYIQISLDGPKEVHDMFRVDQNNKGTHDMSMYGAELLKETKYKRWGFHASCSDFHVKHLYDIYSHLYKHVDKKASKNIFANMQFIHDCDKYNEQIIDEFKEQFIKIITEYPELKDEIKNSFYSSNVNHIFCSAGKNYFSFFADGTIAPCHRVYVNPITNKLTAVGNFITGEWDDTTFHAFFDNNQDCFHGVEKCSNCNSGVCYPCYMANYNNTKDIFVAPLSYCWFKKETDKIIREQLSL